MLFMWIQAINVFYFATWAIYIAPTTDYIAMVVMDAFNVPMCMINFALVVLYLRMHLTTGPLKLKHTLIFAPAFVAGAMEWILYYLMGFDNAAHLVSLYDRGLQTPEMQTSLWQLYVFVSLTVCDSIGLVYGFVAFVECLSILRRGGYRFGYVYRFLFMGNKSTPSRVIAVLMISEILVISPLGILGRHYLFEHYLIGIGLTIILAILINFIAHVEYYSEISNEVTLYSLSHITWTSTMQPDNKTATTKKDSVTKTATNQKAKETPRQQSVHVAEAESVDTTEADPVNVPVAEFDNATSDVTAVQPKSEINISPSAKSEQQAEQLRYLLEKERIYKDENLTISTLSERMGLGRSTLSLMINTNYGMPFRDLVNKYRIEAAKQYMLAHRTATQEVIAMECGFKSASYLNCKFKEVEGVTPMMWLAQQ